MFISVILKRKPWDWFLFFDLNTPCASSLICSLYEQQSLWEKVKRKKLPKRLSLYHPAGNRITVRSGTDNSRSPPLRSDDNKAAVWLQESRTWAFVRILKPGLKDSQYDFSFSCLLLPFIRYSDRMKAKENTCLSVSWQIESDLQYRSGERKWTTVLNPKAIRSESNR